MLQEEVEDPDSVGYEVWFSCATGTGTTAVMLPASMGQLVLAWYTVVTRAVAMMSVRHRVLANQTSCKEYGSSQAYGVG